MARKNLLRRTLLIAGVLLPSAFAYLDPSSGSMLLQVLIGAIATTALVVKSKWVKIKSFFAKRPSQEAQQAVLISQNTCDKK